HFDCSQRSLHCTDAPNYRKCDFHRTDVNENRESIATPCFLCALFLIDMFLIYHISPISTHPITKFFKIFLKRQGVRRSTSQHALELAPESDHSGTPLPQFIQLELATLVNSVPPGDE